MAIQPINQIFKTFQDYLADSKNNLKGGSNTYNLESSAKNRDLQTGSLNYATNSPFAYLKAYETYNDRSIEQDTLAKTLANSGFLPGITSYGSDQASRSSASAALVNLFKTGGINQVALDYLKKNGVDTNGMTNDTANLQSNGVPQNFTDDQLNAIRNGQGIPPSNLSPGNGQGTGSATAPGATPPAQSLPAFTLTGGNLQQTSKGDNVSQLQSLLNQYNSANLKTDGDFGPLTKQAVINFQQKNGLVADGIVGAKTAAALAKLGQPITASNGQSPGQLVQSLGGGATGGAVGTSASARAASKEQGLQAIKDSLNKGAAQPPSYNSLDELTKLRNEQGIVNDEAELAAIQNEGRVAKEQLNQMKQTSNKEISEGGYLGSISEAERNMNFRLESLSLREQAVTSRINSKNAYINTAMQAGQQDYTNALQTYNNEYNKNLQAVQLYNADLDNQKQDAMTAFTTITNLLSKGGTTTLDPALSTQLDNLALQAGLPTGVFQEALKGVGASNQIDNTKIVGDNLYLWTTDASGTPHLKLVQTLPKSSSSGDGTGMTLGQKKTAIQTTLKTGVSPSGEKIGNPKGADGYVDPQVYVAAFENWNGTTQEFLTAFPVTKNVNPLSYGRLPAAIKPTREL